MSKSSHDSQGRRTDEVKRLIKKRTLVLQATSGFKEGGNFGYGVSADFCVSPSLQELRSFRDKGRQYSFEDR